MNTEDRFQWKTRYGEIIKLSDMTDVHLRNAKAYCEKNNFESDLAIINKEIIRRHKKEFMSQYDTCQFCEGTMTMHEERIESEEVGWCMEKHYYLRCVKCASRGPELFFNEKEIIN
jgi:hypothetical protein